MDGTQGCGGIVWIGVIIVVILAAFMGLSTVSEIENAQANQAMAKADQEWARTEREYARAERDRIAMDALRETNLHRESMFQSFSLALLATTNSPVGMCLLLIIGILGASVVGLGILRFWISRTDVGL